MEKNKIILAMSELSTQELEDIISFGRSELEVRNNREWLEAINKVMTAIRNFKNQFPCATCYVECEIDMVREDFDLLELFETVTEDTFQQ